jgi:aspartyl-tRNA(Asn)/glutamyl-tRNA(Gln) amidotransferase subunit B
VSWETVIGLEVHVQLATKSKMFCGCAVTFGDPPNTHVCPVCLGLPGALPVPNAHAVALGVRAALALGGTVHPRSVFARKNYFYPDLPKGYQISQFDEPLATGGAVRFTSDERGQVSASITRLHLEEDAGKSLHDRFPGKTAVDLNRVGAPLAEIVSGPDLRSPAEAHAYLDAVKRKLVINGVSDCSMEKGTLRVDANLSIRRPGDSFGTKTEVKNMNSFANVERALAAERARQAALLEGGGAVEQMTLLFDAADGSVRPVRSKEESHDYRYFPEPDLPPLILEPALIDEQRAEHIRLEKSSEQRESDKEAEKRHLITHHRLSVEISAVLVENPALNEYFKNVAQEGADIGHAASWFLSEVKSAHNATGAFQVEPERLAALTRLVDQGEVSLQAAKRILGEMLESSETPQEVATRLELIQVGDTDQLSAWVSEVLTAFPKEVERYRGGETKLIGFFVGQVMKRSKGQADPKAVQPVLAKQLEA